MEVDKDEEFSGIRFQTVIYFSVAVSWRSFSGCRWFVCCLRRIKFRQKKKRRKRKGTTFRMQCQLNPFETAIKNVKRTISKEPYSSTVTTTSQSDRKSWNKKCGFHDRLWKSRKMIGNWASEFSGTFEKWYLIERTLFNGNDKYHSLAMGTSDYPNCFLKKFGVNIWETGGRIGLTYAFNKFHLFEFWNKKPERYYT